LVLKKSWILISQTDKDTNLVISVADPGSGTFFTRGSGMGVKFGCGMNIPDHISESLETIGLKYLNFYVDTVPGSAIFCTLDPGSTIEKFGSGIRMKHLGFATLLVMPITNTLATNNIYCPYVCRSSSPR
jgi:hypothetical protein